MERNSRGSRGARLAAAAAAAGLPAIADAAREYNLQTPVTVIARQQYDLHMFIFWICAVIFVGVFGVMFYSLWKHRKSVGHQAEQFHENTVVEIVWTVIPFLILLFMAYPATKTILAMKDTSSSELTVKVTGYQWKWNYDYLQDGFGYYSSLSTPLAQIENREPKGEHYLLEVDHPMVVPVDTKVRVLITAGDVLHAFWVPALGVKQDAIPGFVRDVWFRAEKVGTYRGQCAELCGKEHGFMPIVVEVKSKDDYAKWVAEQKQKVSAAAEEPGKVWDAKDLIANGEKVFAANCAACHQPTGKGVPGAFPPLDGSKVVLGPPDDQIHVVLNGRPNTAMASFKALSNADLASVITYTRNAWSNRTGQAIQPAEVQAARAK
ncbi:MAG TPA: cytochrome c oxidase subunit II [Casimicrobiaceae bacterium]|nr:cytochrome c oxidase subunit II [Casimicrobiaceae bacterium]